MVENRPLIFSHIDVDGITSARIVQLTFPYEGADVQFTPYTTFGVQGLKVEPYHDKLICLDIGCSNETLRRLSEISDDISVVLIDHHPPDDDRSVDGSANKNFRPVVDTTHCTASLAFKTFNDLSLIRSEWAGFWAIVGIYGDIADGKEGAREVLEGLNDVYPEISPFLMKGGESITKKLTKKLQEQRWKHHPAKMLSRAMNMARRVAYHHGAKICLNACAEVEGANNPYLMVRNLRHYFDWARYPNIAILRRLAGRYFGLTKEVRETQRVIDIGPLAVGMISSEADIGGVVAKRISTSLGKSCFVFNDSLPEGRCKLSGRGGGDFDLNVLLKAADEVSGGKIAGGGHPMAASGTFSRVPFWEVCRILYQAVEKVQYAEDNETTLS